MFEHRDGPRHIPYELPACVIVEFKDISFAEGTKWWTDLDKKNSFQVIQLPFVNVVLSVKQLLFIKLKEWVLDHVNLLRVS